MKYRVNYRTFNPKTGNIANLQADRGSSGSLELDINSGGLQEAEYEARERIKENYPDDEVIIDEINEVKE